MNRTDRLYALVEELRAIAPSPSSGRWLADRFEVSVRTVEGDVSALQQAAHTALRKLVAAMQGSDAAAARELAACVHLLGPATAFPPVPSLIADALSAGRVLRISYQDRDGAVTTPELETLGYVGTPTNWYVVGWCRRRPSVLKVQGRSRQETELQ